MCEAPYATGSPVDGTRNVPLPIDPAPAYPAPMNARTARMVRHATLTRREARALRRAMKGKARREVVRVLPDLARASVALRAAQAFQHAPVPGEA